ncbi:membrane protease subunit (stomatin/prohibitin family) [Paenibacillus sp. DS2015]|uniref:SPFH domain-containing protein n=1 Tax=Paenibacillus sp. DS2015 TaxID=3373917 RepID=UPI003D1BEB26
MGLFSFLKGQFIEVIEWMDSKGSMVYRFPAYDNAIKMGAKLIVRESQAAIFVNEGKIADIYGPGTYTLSTQNMPLLTALKSWPYAFNSPFKADVYFVSTANFTNLKWGTTNPVIMRDPEFGVVRLRGFGTYSIRVGESDVFLKELFGTNSDFTTDQISGHLKSIITTSISDLIGESKIPVMDLSSSYEELSASALERLQPHMQSMGLILSSLMIENLSLPQEVEQMIDRKSSMNIAGNLDQYMKYQTAEAIREAANNPESGAAGAGAGLGAGMAMGQMMSQMVNRPAEPMTNVGGDRQHDEGTRSSTGKRFCSECGESLEGSAKFCSSCGTKCNG